MTAFKNGRAALAVTAGLVGALSLGSAAIAAAPVSAYAEAGVENSETENLLNYGTYQINVQGTDLSYTAGSKKVKHVTAGTLSGVPNTPDVVVKSAQYDADHKVNVGSYTVNAKWYKWDDDGDGVFEQDADDLSDANVNIANKGSYVVKITLKGAHSSYKYDGAEFYVPVIVDSKEDSTIEHDEVRFFWDGTEYTSKNDSYAGPTVKYDGTDQLANLEVEVENADKAASEDEDYALMVRDSSGKLVKEAVNADTYTVTVEGRNLVVDSDGDSANGNQLLTFTFTVDPIDLHGTKDLYTANNGTSDVSSQDVDFAKLLSGSKSDVAYKPKADSLVGFVVAKGTLADGSYAYTGSTIEASYKALVKPVLKQNAKGGWYLDTEASSWVDVPADDLFVSYKKDGKKADLKDAGDYTASLVLDESTNFKSAREDVDVKVATKSTFTDVDASAWYADSVYKANELGYMTGIAGTSTFGPESGLTRAQAAQVLANMAGAETKDTNSGDYGVYGSFSDVDGTQWYAQAVAWAKSYGVVSGYPDGTFKPDQYVTREEFATMLRNYAQKSGQGEDKTADLSKYTDASQVTWSKGAVSWAVANKVFGQGVDLLAPQATITRGQVAKMVTAFQPDGKLEKL